MILKFVRYTLLYVVYLPIINLLRSGELFEYIETTGEYDVRFSRNFAREECSGAEDTTSL